MRTTIRSAGTGRRRRAGAVGLIAALALVLAAGCTQVKETLTINADGSGSVRVETLTYMPSSLYSMLREFFPDEAFTYPPITRQHVKSLFPGDAFTLDIKRNRTVAHTTGVVVEAQFKDINALLEGPYGAAHSLELVRDGDQLVLKTRSGMQTVARLAPFIKAKHGDDGPLNLDSVRDKYGELAFEFTIVMPAQAQVEGPGATADGSSVTWTAKLAGAEDEAKVLDELDSVVTVRCPAKDVAFEPAKTVRLDLVPFADLKEEPIGEAPVVDLEKIRAATKFVPLVLQVTQSFNLAGQDFYAENGARLHGMVVVPREFEPAQWGDVKLELVEDDQGEDLVVPENEDTSRYRRYGYGSDGFGVRSRRGEDGEEPAEVTHPVTLEFTPPSFEARTIAHIKASVAMRYPGGTHLVCIKDAIAKDLAEKVSLQDVFQQGFGYYSGEEESEEDGRAPVLDKLGLTLTPRKVLRVEGMLVVDLALKTEAGSIVQAQLFDAGGRPWPTSLGGSRYSGLAESVRLCVAGEPELPLSLALIVKAAGPSLDVPIELNDVPIAPAEEKRDEKPADTGTTKDTEEAEDDQ